MGCSPSQDIRLLDDFGNTFFLTIGHQVYSGNAINILNPLNELDAELLALGFCFTAPLKSRNDVVGNMDARHVCADPSRGPGRGEGTDTHQDEALS